MAPFRTARKAPISRSKRLMLITQEHCDNLVEKNFTTLDRLEEEWGDVYKDQKDNWDFEGETLTDQVKKDGSAWFDTKYRSIYVREVTPQNIREILENPIDEWGYKRAVSSFYEDVDEYIDHPDDASYDVYDFLHVTDEELEYLGHSKREIADARREFAKGNYDPLFYMWKETWDPRDVPEEIYPQLEALGVPKRYYDPRANRYRGSGRGTFGTPADRYPAYEGSGSARSRTSAKKPAAMKTTAKKPASTARKSNASKSTKTKTAHKAPTKKPAQKKSAPRKRA